MTNENLLNEYETAIAIYIVASEQKDAEEIANAEMRLNNLKTEILRRMKE